MDATRDYYTKWSKSERERQIPCDTTYMWNLKYGTNEPIYKIETDSQAQRTDSWLPRGWWRREGWAAAGGEQMPTATFKMEKQQAPTV